MTHQGTASKAASVLFRPSIARTDIIVIFVKTLHQRPSTDVLETFLRNMAFSSTENVLR